MRRFRFGSEKEGLTSVTSETNQNRSEREYIYKYDMSMYLHKHSWIRWVRIKVRELRVIKIDGRSQIEIVRKKNAGKKKKKKENQSQDAWFEISLEFVWLIWWKVENPRAGI